MAKEVETAEKQKPKFNADSLALSPDNQYVYYAPILTDTLYHIATAKLLDESSEQGRIT